MIRKAVTQKSLEMMSEYTGATTELPPYNMTQMLHHSTTRTPRKPSHRPEVPETATQQNEIIRGFATIEEEQLDA